MVHESTHGQELIFLHHLCTTEHNINQSHDYYVKYRVKDHCGTRHTYYNPL